MRLLEKKKLEGKLGVIHFIGIGGVGMSGVAKVMHSLGYKVQGSDISPDVDLPGIKVFHGHHENNLIGVKYVVISSAIKSDNPELMAAKKLRLFIIPRSHMLAEIMRFKTCVSVSGSHGKTTTTSLIVHMLEAARINPTVINGGIIRHKGTNSYIGDSDYLIAEADESDSTFLKLPTTIGIITNIDREHVEEYGSWEDLKKAFGIFINNIPFYGFVVACLDDAPVQELVADIDNKQIITYGISNESANVRAFNISYGEFETSFDVKISNLHPGAGDIVIEKVYLPLAGKHNVLNALAAIALAVELDIGPQIIQRAFQGFAGVHRRFTCLLDTKQLTVIDDYAHHPKEIECVLEAAARLAKSREAILVVVCQPHRYSRVADLMEGFVSCFKKADKLYIAPIYSAGEDNKYGISHQDIINRLQGLEAKEFTSIEQLSEDLKKDEAGKVLLFVGAGSISSTAYKFVDALKASSVSSC